ncbi:exported hypothetical protein [uncultured delta proteobacterium]|uniref:Uncharacterized protein n=1 Tax=uncultured delta proteobacterium TaxID=34034 RepID=A0A212JFD1_9DELT|nr:exported hypothetical protein [uncultured delta proteobacterium]
MVQGRFFCGGAILAFVFLGGASTKIFAVLLPRIIPVNFFHLIYICGLFCKISTLIDPYFLNFLFFKGAAKLPLLKYKPLVYSVSQQCGKQHFKHHIRMVFFHCIFLLHNLWSFSSQASRCWPV